MNQQTTRLFRAFSLIVFVFLSAALSAQEILTAERFFNTVSDAYGEVDDYEALITINHGDTTMEGVCYYKSPNLLRINFTEPKDQTIVVDGEKMSLYLPRQNVVLRQQLKRHSQVALASMASSQGLALLKRGYSIAFLDGPDPVPLDEGSDLLVRNLNLHWRSTDEGFRQIIISVDEDLRIRRMKGITADYESFQFDFNAVDVNQGIPDARFQYDEPASAYVIENFLFEPEE
ncbi:LolA family protein [Sediminispirochaeta smaragdinae]|jgi:outer membrane lipoprotein-sorting protein|uniref:Outer membrane lipoprotein carrier protein LolA n=1 Tax=Sediminispirochaeta smaragdinae (strain DSM 11293 / JCM 15392 / SEBR 4228) TaxID=573413 RepID=E1R7Z1_SEDSS|nr:outer-membrane lipoprotein carrier protein LolA [Sediminispirochaeta smaragdinae]ADK82846.1 outer membrane lipoprotein carrier protein LolA [Sediminispirochaeta smaragdinae DSM 11293]